MSSIYADVYVKTAADVPQEEHYAVITGTIIHVPGDERSIQAPGHGYPAHTEHAISYQAFLTFEKLETWMHAQDALSLRHARIIHVKPMVFTLKLEVKK